MVENMVGRNCIGIDDIVLINEKIQFWELSQSGNFAVLFALCI